MELNSKRMYLFNPIAEVFLLEQWFLTNTFIIFLSLLT
jgi:hypothetical protein